MSQTTVSAGGQAIGVAGQKADSGDCDVVSGFNMESSAQIPFGFGLRNATASGADAYLLPTGFSNVIAIDGLSVFSYNHVRAGAADAAGAFGGDLGASGLLPKASLQVARKGRFLVPVEAAVSVNDRAWCRGIGTGAFTPGIWRGAALNAAGPLGASYHIDCTRQAVFRTASYTAADGTTLVAVLEVDFTSRP